MQTVFGVLLILHLVFLLLVSPTSALRPREQAPNFKAKAGMFLIHFATMSPSALAVQLVALRCYENLLISPLT